MQYESSGYVTSTVVTEQRNKFVADISSTNETNRPVANRQASTKPVNQQGKSRHPTDIKMTFSSPMKVKESKTYAVKMPADKSACDITSLCTLADGTIIAVDNANKNLKHLNSSDFHIMDTCDLPESPWQLCAISQQEVAVCCSDANIIQFVSVEQNMKTTKKIDTEFYCCGLAHAAGKLYVSEFNLLSEQPEYLYILTLSGEVLQQFSVDQSGHRLFNNISSLAISNDNNKIYVADWDKGLVVLNRNGNLIRQFNGQELTDAFGVCVDKTGNVLVSGLRSNNVLQFSSDGELIGEVMKTNDSCQAICFLQDNSKMIISFENKNEIEVYDIS
jgi:sugar lactone lactonase YvrE